MHRREFIKRLGGALFCACAGGVGTSGCASGTNVPPAPPGSYRRQGDHIILSLTTVDSLRAIGSAVSVVLDAAPVDGDAPNKILIVHLATDVYRAYANRCTHRGKELNYLHADQRLECVSGKTHFDLAGDIIKGPAKEGLLLFPSRREGDELIIEA